MQRIQEETGCKLQFKNDDTVTDYKTAMLTGTPQQLHAAESKILSIIDAASGKESLLIVLGCTLRASIRISAGLFKNSFNEFYLTFSLVCSCT